MMSSLSLLNLKVCMRWSYSSENTIAFHLFKKCKGYKIDIDSLSLGTIMLESYLIILLVIVMCSFSMCM
jgi:hypothetical protein